MTSIFIFRYPYACDNFVQIAIAIFKYFARIVAHPSVFEEKFIYIFDDNFDHLEFFLLSKICIFRIAHVMLYFLCETEKEGVLEISNKFIEIGWHFG